MYKHDPFVTAVPDPHLYVRAEKRDGSVWIDEARNIKGWYWEDMFYEASPHDVVAWEEATKTPYADSWE